MNLIIYLDVVLNPQFKLRYAEFASMNMHEGVDEIILEQFIKMTFYDIFYYYKMKILEKNRDGNTNYTKKMFDKRKQ